MSSAGPDELACLAIALRALSEHYRFTWDGTFWQRISYDIPKGRTGELKPYQSGPFPKFLILTFFSRAVAGPPGERLVVVESWETMEAVLERVATRLMQPKRKNPFRFIMGQDAEQ